MTKIQQPQKIQFGISPSAELLLQNYLPNYFKICTSLNQILLFAYTGRIRVQDGDAVFRDLGPCFQFFGTKAENLHDGKYYDLFGFPTWISDLPDFLLKGRVLTTKMVGDRQLFTIENAPEDFLGSVFEQNASCPRPSGSKE